MFIRHVLMRKVSLQAFPGLNEIPTRLQRQEEKDREDLPILCTSMGQDRA